MRFGRIILLAGLAPLLSLSAMAAPILPQAPEHSHSGKKSLVEFLRSLTILTASPEAAIAPAAEKSSPRAVLAVAALATTPLRHSLWMIRRPASASLPSRQPMQAPLRC